MTSFCSFAITTALLTLGACHAAPAHAGVGTAAWTAAGSICRALGADLGTPEGKAVDHALRATLGDGGSHE